MAVELVVWGGSGHAKVLRPIIEAGGRRVVAVVERNHAIDTLPFSGAFRLQGEDDLVPWLQERSARPLEYVVAIGGHHGSERLRLAAFLHRHGLTAFTAMHARAFIAETATVGPGCHILPMAAVCEEATLGAQTIVNTNASVDHECRLGAGVHVMPGATLAGCVTIGDHVTIGSNATIFPSLTIGRGARVGAGSVVTRDVPAGAKVVGAPARQR